MNIAHIIGSLNIGGTERLLVDLCKQNDYKRNTLMVIIINDEVNVALMSELRMTGAQVLELRRCPGGSTINYILLLRKILAGFGPQVLHMHNDISAFFGILGAAFRDYKLVLTLHAVNVMGHWKHARVLNLLVPRFIDHLIAISQSVKKDFVRQTSVNAGRIAVVHNGICLERFHWPKRPTGLTTIICVASLNCDIKGQDVLIRALALLKKDQVAFRCFLVGEGRSRTLLEKMIVEYNLRDEVSLLGLRGDVPELLAKSDIFVLPSRYEGFGISVIESMASGTPVVVANIDGLKEIVTDCHNGVLFESGDEKDLCKKMKLLINDSVLAETVKRNALNDVQSYKIDEMYRKYLNVYELVLSSDRICCHSHVSYRG